MITPWNNEEEGAKPDAVGQMMRKRAAVLGRKNDRIIIVVDFIGLDNIMLLVSGINSSIKITTSTTSWVPRSANPPATPKHQQAAAVGSRGDARTYQYVP